MVSSNIKRLAVSVEVHRFIMRAILDSDEFKSVDEYLRDKLRV